MKRMKIPIRHVQSSKWISHRSSLPKINIHTFSFVLDVIHDSTINCFKTDMHEKSQTTWEYTALRINYLYTSFLWPALSNIMTVTIVTFREALRETIRHYHGSEGEVILSEGGE
jgi:hypothetical protein